MKVLGLAVATIAIVSSASMVVVKDVSAQSLQKKFSVQASVARDSSVGRDNEALRRTLYPGAAAGANTRDPAGPANVSD